MTLKKIMLPEKQDENMTLRDEIYGGFWVRLMAHNIDLVILLPLFYLLSFLVASDKLLYGICITLTFLYELIFIGSSWRATPGKRILKLQVVHIDNKSLSWQRAILRTLSKVITITTLFIGYGVIIFHPKKRGLHDIISGSKVILIPEQ